MLKKISNMIVNWEIKYINFRTWKHFSNTYKISNSITWWLSHEIGKIIQQKIEIKFVGSIIYIIMWFSFTAIIGI